MNVQLDAVECYHYAVSYRGCILQGFFKIFFMLSEVIIIISAYTCVAHAHSACIVIKIDSNYIKKSQVGYVKIAPPGRGI